MSGIGFFDRIAVWLGQSSLLVVLLAAGVIAVYVLALVLLLSRPAQARHGIGGGTTAGAAVPVEWPASDLAAMTAPSPGPQMPAWASPRGRIAFSALAAMFAASLWGAAALLAPDLKRFLASREWHAQPLYLFAHAATVRLFASILTENFLAGAAHLKADPAITGAQVRQLIGVMAPVGALVVATPFALMDLGYFLSDAYPKLSGQAMPVTADWIMFGIWSVEWVLNAMVWLMLLGFLWLNVQTLRAHAFRAPVHTVLLQRHYRPFLRMSVQGASVVLAFSIATAGYILYAGGALTDYLGLIITVGLLPLCFVPPWVVVRRKVDRLVSQENAALHLVLHETEQTPSREQQTSPDQTLTEATAMLRLMHLERLHDSVGRREATAVTLRIIAPAATIGWQLWQNGAQALERVLALLRAAG
jgi:hypothetical protein